jgi:alpha-D-ribose 1-methylphosphonate 5-triphosphate synthase subunit PhnL
MELMIAVQDIEKGFVLHLQGGVSLSVLKHINLDVASGECVVLSGPSGSGKSTFLRLLYGNCKPGRGNVLVRHEDEMVNIGKVESRRVLDIRKRTLGYVSQFLRVIPRIPAIRVIMEPMRALGISAEEARPKAEDLLERLHIPQRLWGISPTTFSGGEQQRINIARCFALPYPILLLDEPTAALDAFNRNIVVELIREARERGTAIVGVFHDEEVRDAVSTRIFDLSSDEEKNEGRSRFQ